MTPRQKIDNLINQCSMLELTASVARQLSEERLRNWDSFNRRSFLKCVNRLQAIDETRHSIPSITSPQYIPQMDNYLFTVILIARSTIQALETLDITETF
jgi:hypothetical protein